MTKIVILNPRGMSFGEQRATSIDLSVRDLVAHSRFRSSTTVVGDPIADPFPGIDYMARPIGQPDSFYFRMNRLVPVIRDLKPDLVSVQEHLATAAHLARRLTAPVLLHMHNPVRHPKHAIERFSRRRSYRAISGMVFVSHDHRASFEEIWPEIETPRHIVPNALDMQEWRPAASRENVVLVVGRAIPEKRIKEAADAMAATLPRYPNWKAVFILSAVDSYVDYVTSIRSALASLGPQAEILIQRPFADVKTWTEKASIAVVSSMMRETFGRAALEAHAGGAAVISSGRGGLREVSGDHAIYLGRVSPGDISQAVSRLIESEAERRALAVGGHKYALAHFDIRTTAGLCDNLYERVIAQRDSGQRS